MIASTSHSRTRSTAPDWNRLVACLVARAVRRRVPLPRNELVSLAGLAVAKANAYFDPDTMSGPLGRWVYNAGWRLLMFEVRNEFRRRRRADVTFTDMTAATDECEFNPVASASQTAALSGRGADVEFLFQGLSAFDRCILALRAQGFTHEQIGRRCGVSRETVRVRLVRLRAVIEQRVRDHA